jgi:hypothetical protein
MAMNSDEKPPILAQWIKYALFLNVLFFLILVLFWILTAGLTTAAARTGTQAMVLVGLNVAAFLIYEQLFRPDDDFWRKIAKFLGYIQVAGSCLSFLFIVVTIALIISPGLSGFLSAAAGSQPVTAGTTLFSTTTTVPAVMKPTDCYQTSTGCMPLAPSPTVPPYGNPIRKNDSIIGSFIFDKAQFSPKEEYKSRAGNYEYNYLSVPLDHSPDIQWTFRDDGVLLFYDTTNGNLLRTGTWTKSESGTGKTEYRVKRGNLEYRGMIQDDVFQITYPDYWKMIKTP